METEAPWTSLVRTHEVGPRCHSAPVTSCLGLSLHPPRSKGFHLVHILPRWDVPFLPHPERVCQHSKGRLCPTFP